MLTSTVTRIEANGNDVTTVFPYNFLILAQTDLDVYEVVITTGVATLKTITTHYTVSGVGSNSGGNVTFVTAPASTVRVLIVRTMDLTQLTDYQENNRFPAETHEQALDRVTMITQQLQEVDSRCIKIPLSSTQENFELPDPDLTGSRDKGIFINALGTGLEAREVLATDIANPLTTKGDFLSYTTAPVRVGIGTNDTMPVADSTVAHGWTWKTPATILSTFLLGLLTTKGDTIVRTASAAVRKAVGADGKLLAADSNDTDGIKYVNVGLPNFRGVVRSHPDSDSAATKIRADLEMVTTNDGHYYAPAQGLIFDKAVTGSIGGMQAAAVNSTWNKLYYARKRSDGSEGLWGLRAKNYLADQSQTTVPSSELLRDASARTKLAQGIQVTNTGKLDFADFDIGRTASPVGNFWFTVESDSAGSPSGTVLATSDKYDAARVPTSAIYIRLPFRTPATLTAGTQYHLVLQGDFTIGANNIFWGGNTANSYANGVAKKYDGAVWTAAATVLDFSFKLYVTQNDTALSLPSGYDQYVQIGWFYIDGSGNIKKFRAQDRRIWTDAHTTPWEMIASLGGTLTLNDVSAFVPPVPVQLGYGWRGSAAAYLAFGGLEVTDLNAGNVENISGQRMTYITASDAATGVRYDGQEISVEYQGFMGMASTGTNEIYALMMKW